MSSVSLLKRGKTPLKSVNQKMGAGTICSVSSVRNPTSVSSKEICRKEELGDRLLLPCPPAFTRKFSPSSISPIKDPDLSFNHMEDPGHYMDRSSSILESKLSFPVSQKAKALILMMSII